MEMKRPFGITFIGYFYVFGAIVLLLTLGVKQEIGMNIRFGLPHTPEIIVRISMIALSLSMGYGYLNMKRWGYWTMIVYSLLFLGISLNQVAVYNSQPFIGNVIFSLIVLIYTVVKRNLFLKSLRMSSKYV
jgi:hypothetical protein